MDGISAKSVLHVVNDVVRHEAPLENDVGYRFLLEVIMRQTMATFRLASSDKQALLMCRNKL